ncbi:hypothetical protein EYF80_064739 [Liparis tanakae]|uniref:Uncharacterized protein n=1 Tax=Liparis tanakae TaxID=230148 RepID=A0A4Z2E8X1_9TELE|nr:hypothetical protein EYF80_064739 [Liparis tanakae]
MCWAAAAHPSRHGICSPGTRRERGLRTAAMLSKSSDEEDRAASGEKAKLARRLEKLKRVSHEYGPCLSE